MKVSNAVNDCIHNLWAVLATRAAQGAMDKVKYNDVVAAEELAKTTERWLARAGARASRFYFQLPR